MKKINKKTHTRVRVAVLSQMLEFNKEDFVVVNDVRHSVNGTGRMEGANYHCYFYFRSPKDSSKEDRRRMLGLLFDSMVERVEDAHNGAADGLKEIKQTVSEESITLKVNETEWVLCDTNSEGYGQNVKIYFRNGESPLCCVVFTDGPLKNRPEVTFVHLLRPLGSSDRMDVFYKRCDRVEVYDPGSKYHGRKGVVDCDVRKGREIYVKLDDGQTIFTYTKFIKKI